MTGQEYKELIKTVPQEHPFVRASICDKYYFNDEATYITTPAYDAYTLPAYNEDDRIFEWIHIDMDDDNRFDFEYSDLSDLVDYYCGGVFSDEVFNSIVDYYKIPKEVIDEEIEALGWNE